MNYYGDSKLLRRSLFSTAGSSVYSVPLNLCVCARPYESGYGDEHYRMGSSPVGAGNPLPAVDYGQGLYAVQLAAGVGGLTQQSAAVLGPRPTSGAEKN